MKKIILFLFILSPFLGISQKVIRANDVKTDSIKVGNHNGNALFIDGRIVPGDTMHIYNALSDSVESILSYSPIWSADSDENNELIDDVQILPGTNVLQILEKGIPHNVSLPVNTGPPGADGAPGPQGPPGADGDPATADGYIGDAQTHVSGGVLDMSGFGITNVNSVRTDASSSHTLLSSYISNVRSFQIDDVNKNLWFYDGDDYSLAIQNLTGNLGVGTTAPTQKLHVNGKIRIQGGNYGESMLKFNNWDIENGQTGYSTQSLGLYNNGTLEYRFMGTSLNTLGNDILTGTGKIGVGTNLPGGEITVSGVSPRFRIQSTGFGSSSSPAFGAIEFGAATGAYTTGRIRGNSYAANFAYGDIVIEPTSNLNGTYQENALIVKGNTGNVGIGTASPVRKLHVLASESPLQLETTNAVNFTRLINSSGITDYGSNGSNFQINAISGTTHLNKGLVDNQLIAFDGVTGNNSYARYHSQYLEIRRPVADGGQKVRLSGVSTNYLENNLGIGISSPSQKLHVEGSSIITGTIYSESAGSNIRVKNSSTNESHDGAILKSSDNSYYWSRWDVSGGLKLKPDNNIHTLGAGNLGIGNSNPLSKLHVTGSLRVDGSSSSIIYSDGLGGGGLINGSQFYWNTTNGSQNSQIAIYPTSYTLGSSTGARLSSSGDINIIEGGISFPDVYKELSTATNIVSYDPTEYGKTKIIEFENQTANTDFRSSGVLIDGTEITYINLTAFDFTFHHNDTSGGTIANGRYYFPSSSDVTIPQYGSVTFRYSSSVGSNGGYLAIAIVK